MELNDNFDETIVVNFTKNSFLSSVLCNKKYNLFFFNETLKNLLADKINHVYFYSMHVLIKNLGKGGHKNMQEQINITSDDTSSNEAKAIETVNPALELVNPAHLTTVTTKDYSFGTFNTPSASELALVTKLYRLFAYNFGSTFTCSLQASSLLALCADSICENYFYGISCNYNRATTLCFADNYFLELLRNITAELKVRQTLKVCFSLKNMFSLDTCSNLIKNHFSSLCLNTNLFFHKILCLKFLRKACNNYFNRRNCDENLLYSFSNFYKSLIFNKRYIVILNTKANLKKLYM